MVKPSLGLSGFSIRMELLSRTKKGWLLKGLDKSKELTMIKPLQLLQDLKPSGSFLLMLPTWVSWYQANPKESHLVAVKRILRYLKGTLNLGLWYPKGSGFDLKAYLDSDYAGCNLDRKSTSGGCQILGGKLVCWSAKKQSSIAMSSAEAEYVAATGCCAQVLWIKSFDG
ncbi:hypothetical protein Tco_0956607 [Tanacetum coccineum]